jgi:hypothetical protein
MQVPRVLPALNNSPGNPNSFPGNSGMRQVM